MGPTRSRERRGRPRLRLSAAVLAPVVVAGFFGLTWSPAGATTSSRTPATTAMTAPALAPTDGSGTSPTESESAGNCVAYANGTGMGSYCLTGSAVDVLNLRQRFPGQTFRPCRYEKPPEGISVPRNPNPDKGRWLMQTCLTNIDFDTISGGSDKRLSMQLVWMPYSSDTTYEDPNALERWLWDVVAYGTQYPVPYLRPKPNYVPLVGVPTYFEFDWLDPETKQPVSDENGPYAGEEAHGGPFVQTRNGNLIMRAIATDVTIDPKQSDMNPTKCGNGMQVEYDESKPAGTAYHGDACHLTFKRSSAAARAKSTHYIPRKMGEVYYLKVTVEWKVTYGRNPDNMKPLGDGFTMVSYQPLPVQEIQAPNIPPVMIF